RFTFAAGRNGNPIWSPDGSRVLYGHQNQSGYLTTTVVRLSNGAGKEEVLLPERVVNGVNRFLKIGPVTANGWSSGTMPPPPTYGSFRLEEMANPCRSCGDRPPRPRRVFRRTENSWSTNPTNPAFPRCTCSQCRRMALSGKFRDRAGRLRDGRVRRSST